MGYSSLTPTKYKINLIKSSVNRAIITCKSTINALGLWENYQNVAKNGYLIKISQNIICKATRTNQNPDTKLCPNQQLSLQSIAYRYFLNCSLLIVSPSCKLKNQFVIFDVCMISNW